MKFDVIIATYNREESLKILVNHILKCSKLPENIIIVDSSDFENRGIKNKSLVKYQHTKHKNQPFQRYLGFLLSKSDILVYFDDFYHLFVIFVHLINRLSKKNELL